MKRLLAVLLCAAMLCSAVGCSRIDQPESAPESSQTSLPASIPEETSSAAPEESEQSASRENEGASQQESSKAAPLAEFDQQSFEEYFAVFARFFHNPAETPQELSKDYSMGYFLVYESWQAGIAAGNSYEQDANFFYLIPEEEISATAEWLLGFPDFEPSQVTEWPFGKNPPDGFQFYSEESSLPYLEVISQTVNCQDDMVTVQATCETGMGNEGETPPTVSLVYEFRRIARENGEIYQLVSIKEG